MDSEGAVYASKLERNMSEWFAQMRPDLVLQKQVRFELQPKFRLDHNDTLVRAIGYIADFVIGPTVLDGDTTIPLPGSMVIDAKGKETPEFKTKAKLFRYKFGQPVVCVKSKKVLVETLKLFSAFEAMDKFIKNRAADKLPFIVKGYQDTAGNVKDLTVQIIGKAGYLALVKESRDILAIMPFPASLSPEEAVLWDTARTELLESYAKRLGEREAAQSPERVSHENLQAICDSVALLDGDPDKVVVFSLVCRDSKVISSVETTKVFKLNKTSMKARIEKLLPIGSYLFRINLYPGKYAGLELTAV